MRQSAPEVVLRVDANEEFLPLVVAFTEKAALCLGLGQEETLGLTLASQAIFSYLSRNVLRNKGCVELRCSSGGYYVRADFLFQAPLFDMRAFNITTTFAPGEEDQFEDIDLLVASRSVDRFHVTENNGQVLRLAIIKEKSYPEVKREPANPRNTPKTFTIREPHSEEVKLLSRFTHSHYGSVPLPGFFAIPGKVADMVASGEYSSAVAIGDDGDLVGGMIWHWMGRRTVRCFGPFVFVPVKDPSMAEALLHHCINAIARSAAVGLVNMYPTPEFPRREFESLGKISFCSESRNAVEVTAWFRLMHEDPGATVWAHPDIEDFLRREYRRLVLPREIRSARHFGERQSPHSVLSAEFDRRQGRVSLYPIWAGEDVEENIRDHLRLFRREGLPRAFFIMDLGQPWQCTFAPGLLANDFVPKLVLPCAGEGDLVFFQYEGDLSC